MLDGVSVPPMLRFAARARARERGATWPHGSRHGQDQSSYARRRSRLSRSCWRSRPLYLCPPRPSWARVPGPGRGGSTRCDCRHAFSGSHTHACMLLDEVWVIQYGVCGRCIQSSRSWLSGGAIMPARDRHPSTWRRKARRSCIAARGLYLHRLVRTNCSVIGGECASAA